MLAFFSALLSSRGKRLGDYAAGTYVVRDRVRLRLPPPAADAPAPRLVGARSADIAALPTGLALAVRQYLGRLPAIDPQSRETIGRRLADQVRAVRRASPAALALRPTPTWRPSSSPAASGTRRASAREAELRLETDLASLRAPGEAQRALLPGEKGPFARVVRVS